MSSSTGQPEGVQHTVPIGSVFTARRPDEISAPITKEEFLTLCDGEPASAKRKRDYCRDMFAAALIATISLVANVDWDNFSQRPHKWVFFLTAIVFLVAVGAFGAGWIIFGCLITEKESASHYLRVKTKLETDFQNTEKIGALLRDGGGSTAALGQIESPISQTGDGK